MPLAHFFYTLADAGPKLRSVILGLSPYEAMSVENAESVSSCLDELLSLLHIIILERCAVKTLSA